MEFTVRLTLLLALVITWTIAPELAVAQQTASAEGVGMTTAEFDEGDGAWTLWIGAAVIGAFGLLLVFLIRRFSFGSRQRPTNTDRSAADNRD